VSLPHQREPQAQHTVDHIDAVGIADADWPRTDRGDELLDSCA